MRTLREAVELLKEQKRRKLKRPVQDVWDVAHPGVLQHPDLTKERDDDNWTPLHHAAAAQKAALKHPKVATVKDDEGFTPLHLAAKHHKEALKHPMVAKIKDDFGESPLHRAVEAFPKTALKHPAVKQGGLEGAEDWWDRISDNTKMAYLRAHPRSKYKL